MTSSAGEGEGIKSEVNRSTEANAPGSGAERVVRDGQSGVASNASPLLIAGALDLRWPFPPAQLELTDHEIHVWSAPLDGLSSLLPSLAQTLSATERQRADRFQFDRDRLRFIARRGLLRWILGRYLNVDPAQLSFTSSSRGKPGLAATNEEPVLHFNLSHSEGLALFAVARNFPLGVDVERLRPIAEADQIAAKFFSARESSMLNSRPGNSMLEAFFHCWTAKEAFLKATGKGITDSLADVEVSLRADLKPELLRIGGDAQVASLWRLHDLAPAPGFVGTLAVKARGLKLSCWCWPQLESKSAP